MIKLPLNIATSGHERLEGAADAGARQAAERCRTRPRNALAEGGDDRLIRPIVLVQVERTGKEQRGAKAGGKAAHSQRRRAGVPDAAAWRVRMKPIRVKTAENDGLEDVDLMDPDCPVEWIITKSGLAGRVGLPVRVHPGVAQQHGQRQGNDAVGRPRAAAAVSGATAGRVCRLERELCLLPAPVGGRDCQASQDGAGKGRLRGRSLGRGCECGRRTARADDDARFGFAEIFRICMAASSRARFICRDSASRTAATSRRSTTSSISSVRCASTDFAYSKIDWDLAANHQGCQGPLLLDDPGKRHRPQREADIDLVGAGRAGAGLDGRESALRLPQLQATAARRRCGLRASASLFTSPEWSRISSRW